MSKSLSCALFGLFLASAATLRADTIQYSTSGYFGGVPGQTFVTSGSESISFGGVSNIVVDTPSIVSFGAFTPSFGAAGSTGSFAGDSFTLVISEIDNGVPLSKPVTGSLTGSLRVSADSAPSSDVFVNFGSTSVNFTESNGNIASYTPFSTPIGTKTTTLQGEVDSNPPPVTPIPASCFGAGGLIGLIAIRNRFRRILPS